MQRFLYSHWFVFFVCIVLVSGCGRKQKNIYQFPEKETVKLDKLEYSSVKGLQATSQADGIFLSWHAIQIPKQIEALGYNVYRLPKGRFVPKEPINKTPIDQTHFLDTTLGTNQQQFSYVVRAILIKDDCKIQSLSSRVVTCDRSKK